MFSRAFHYITNNKVKCFFILPMCIFSTIGGVIGGTIGYYRRQHMDYKYLIPSTIYGFTGGMLVGCVAGIFWPLSLTYVSNTTCEIIDKMNAMDKAGELTNGSQYSDKFGMKEKK